MNPVITDLHTEFEGFARYLIATIRLVDGTIIRREIEDHGDAAVVLPYDPERRIVLLVRQFRPPAFLKEGAPDVLEAPAGLLDDDAPDVCARREAMEEVGVRLSALEPVYAGWSTPGVSTERLHGFLAPFGDRDRIGPGGGLASENEAITVVEMGLDELARLSDGGGVVDLKTLLLVQALRLRHPCLFASGTSG